MNRLVKGRPVFFFSRYHLWRCMADSLAFSSLSFILNFILFSYFIFILFYLG